MAYEEARTAAGGEESSECPGNGKNELHGMSDRWSRLTSNCDARPEL